MKQKINMKAHISPVVAILLCVGIIYPVTAIPSISLGDETWGSKWFCDSGVPSNTLGSTNDFYLNDANGNIYEKSGGVWSYKYSFTIPDTTQFFFLNGTRALTGSMDAGGYNITNVGAPAVDDDAATKEYVDTEISEIDIPDTTKFYWLNGTRMLTGDMNAGGYDITNLSPPDSDLEAATKKYVDDEISGISSITLADVYPVGSIYISVVSTNPNTLFGFGTWSAFGTGRVLVGIDGSDADFNSVKETGGSKTATSTGTVSAPTFTGTPSTSVVNHKHKLSTILRTSTSGSVTTYVTESSDTSSTADATRETDNPTSGGVASYTPAGSISAPTFTGTNSTIVQPYIVVYMWERTA